MSQKLDPQNQFTVSVVIPTLIRPSLRRAAESIFNQDVDGTIHLLIGIDKQIGDTRILEELISSAPDNVFVSVVDPGFSTSVRHGGLYNNLFGGAIVTIASYIANSQYVAYLGDDNWFAPNHLSSLLDAIKGKAWAFSKRWYVHPNTLEPLCVDDWESVGPNAGLYLESFGGFVDPNTLMLDKAMCHMLLPLWSTTLHGYPAGDTSDRVVFGALLQEGLAWGQTGLATSYYVIDPGDGNHPVRCELMRREGVRLPPFETDGTKILSRDEIAAAQRRT